MKDLFKAASAPSGCMTQYVMCLLGIFIKILRNTIHYFKYNSNLNQIVKGTIDNDKEMYPAVSISRITSQSLSPLWQH